MNGNLMEGKGYFGKVCFEDPSTLFFFSIYFLSPGIRVVPLDTGEERGILSEREIYVWI